MMAPKIAMSGAVNILQQKKPLSNYFATLLPAFVTMIFSHDAPMKRTVDA